MKKTIVSALIAALLLSLLAGCGAAPAPAAPAAPAEAPAVTEAPAAEAPAVTEAPAAEEPVTETVPIRLGALTGPTAMGLVKLLADDAAAEAPRYQFLLGGAADELMPRILQGELDVAAVPLNLGAVIYNKTGGAVELAAVNVLGVLYLCEYGESRISSWGDLRGQTVYSTGKGAMPEYFLRYLLTENGLDPDADLTVEFKSEPAEVVALLKASDYGVALLPQPYVIAAKGQLGEDFRPVLSLSKAWDELDNGSRCVTAGILVRREFAQAHPEAVEDFLRDFAASAAWVNDNAEEAGALCEQYGVVAKAAVAAKAIPQCNIVCLTGGEMRQAASGCLQVLFDMNPAAVGGAMPGDDYYYGA